VRANQVTGLPAQLAELLAQPPGEPPAARPARTGLPSEPPGEPPGQQEAGGFAGAPPPGEPPGLADGGQPQPGLPPIELIVAGDATLPPGLPVALRNRFSTDVHVRYGCAEAGLGLSTCPDDPPDEAAGCIGYPAPGVTVVLRDAGGTEVTAGQTGEILLRSAACMNGYWHDQAASAAAFTSDRFVRTGDSGHLDERGRVILVGRVARQ
jgi:long-chain acyl-CoA synthetase